MTDETIRRDLAQLAELGVVRRTHGGAVSARARDETNTAVRLREHASEKIAIGERAAKLVSTAVDDPATRGPRRCASPARCGTCATW